jgi:hypothetical protein
MDKKKVVENEAYREELAMDKSGIIHKVQTPKTYLKINKKGVIKGTRRENITDEDFVDNSDLTMNTSDDIYNIITIFVKMLCENKKKLNYNYSYLMEKILRSKNDEKKSITDILDELNADERSADNQMRSLGLGKWSKGSGRIYSKDRYEEERDEMKEMARKLSNKAIVEEAGDDDIVIEDIIKEHNVNEEIEEEEYGMGHIGEDNDNYGEEEERDYGDYDD